MSAQIPISFQSHDGVETCRSCGATAKCHLFELDRPQIEFFEATHKTPGRFGNETKFVARICKGCLRKLRKAGLDPALTQYEWSHYAEAAE